MKLTRKELAGLLSVLRKDRVTVTMVRKNEKRWGLGSPVSERINQRVLRYDVERALVALRERGVVSEGASAPVLALLRRPALTALTFPAILHAVAV